jgi:protein TonB
LRLAPTSTASEPPPSIEVTTSTIPDEVAGLSPALATLPAFGASVSTGVTEANLIRKVNPTYPPEARIQRLAGSVILDATIAEDGSIHEVKVISGPPLLAAAATAAIRQWRYSPSLLSGKPIEVQKRITIVFRLP